MVVGDPVCTAFQQAKYVFMIFIRNIERYGYAFHDASSVIARQETTPEIAVFRDYSINRDGTDTAEFTVGGLAHTRNPVIVDEGKTMVSAESRIFFWNLTNSSCRYSDATNQFRKFAASRMPRRGTGGGSNTRTGTSAARTAIGPLGTDAVNAVVAGATALG
jgi:hypothetical protein